MVLNTGLKPGVMYSVTTNQGSDGVDNAFNLKPGLQIITYTALARNQNVENDQIRHRTNAQRMFGKHH